MSNKAQEIFDAACDLDSETRSELLRNACGDDSSLRNEVESPLAAHDRAGQFMAQATSEFVEPAPLASSLPEEPGKMVGRYKLLEVIGEGGFGVVYMAQQTEPIRRRVALKIIKLGMDTKQVVARFEAERQALAMMDHPHIARVIDGGATDTGRPYFVMELVRGDPITAYCDRERLTTRARLELFQQVCLAVQHAHQKGIIHRDIKPSNVLVTISDDKPLVKVIDFGIAKATNSELTEKTLFTEFRQLIGTPQYMSPEQAERSGVDVDTRTDIYSLGVLLYEMLTGRTPIDPKLLGSAAWHELQRIICEEEATKPSLLVASASGDLAEVAKRRSTEANSLGGILRGDLDWIVLKALDKDRSRRYATASQLAEDVGRYLNDEPVEATPPSVTYRFSKFARRNKRLLVAATAIALALVVGLISTSTAAIWAMRERELAEAASRDALDAKTVADQETRRARRSAIILGASLMLPEDEAKALADEWRADIDAQRASRSKPDKELTREEAQLAAWYGNWLLQRRKPREAREVITACYDRVKREIGRKDATFLMLSNANVQAHLGANAPAATLVSLYEDVLVAVEHVMGLPGAIALYPEYSSQLAKAGRDADAAEAIRKYLAYRKNAKASPSALDHMRLDMTLDDLVRWSDDYPDLYQELKAYRETGIVAGDVTDPESDHELAADLQTLQGVWESKQTGGIPDSVRMVQEFQGSKVTSKWFSADGKLVHGRSGTFELSRSGACRVLTSYSGDVSQGSGSFIYKIENDQLKVVSGMLTNHPSLPQTLLFVYTRVAVSQE